MGSEVTPAPTCPARVRPLQIRDRSRSARSANGTQEARAVPITSVPDLRQDVETRAAPGLAERYREVRGQTEHLCEPLEPEDMVLQSMTDTSPAKWHLAHTTW